VRAAIVEFLESRFGECPAEVATALEGLADLERLRKLRREVFKAGTLAEALATVSAAVAGAQA